MKAVVVLGMHRSGTSAVAGALAGLGLFPGNAERLVAPDRHNAKGYIEHREVVDRNEAILASAVARLMPEALWRKAVNDPETLAELSWVFAAWLPAGDDAPLDPAAASGIQETLRRLEREAPALATWVLKDPRFALTLHHWLPFLNVAAAVAVVRNPADVAHSLLRRDGILPGVSRDLWALYLRGVLREAAGVPTLVVDYNLLLRSPAETLGGIAGFLRGRGVGLSREEADDAASFLSPELRHSPATAIDLPEPLVRVYESLRAAHLTELASAAVAPIPLPADPEGWIKALYLAARHERDDLERRNILLAERLHGLNVNRLTGPVVRLLRRLKGDPTVGEWRVAPPRKG